MYTFFLKEELTLLEQSQLVIVIELASWYGEAPLMENSLLKVPTTFKARFKTKPKGNHQPASLSKKPRQGFDN